MIERMDYEAIEAVEEQLDQFIERRAREARDQERIEELWEESARRDRERRREENRLAWLEYERHMKRLHAGLCKEHRAKAAALLNTEGVASPHGE